MPGPSRVEMWALAHPIRFRLYELLRNGPATGSQLGRTLGESSGVTSYHLRVLARPARSRRTRTGARGASAGGDEPRNRC